MTDGIQSWRILDGFDRYQRAAMRTMPKLPKRDALQMLALGLAGEAGETVDGVKKFLYHGHAELSKDAIVQELGDLLWYIANIANLYDLQLSQVAEFNIAKLLDRYPDGFSEDASRNRVNPIRLEEAIGERQRLEYIAENPGLAVKDNGETKVYSTSSLGPWFEDIKDAVDHAIRSNPDWCMRLRLPQPKSRIELREDNGVIGGIPQRVKFHRATRTETPLHEEHNIIVDDLPLAEQPQTYGTDTL